MTLEMPGTEQLTARQQKYLAEGIRTLPPEKQAEVEQFPASFVAFLYPEFAQYGPRFFLWQAGMNDLERQLRSYDAEDISIDLRDTYYLYTVDPRDLANSGASRSKKWRSNNILSKVPPSPKHGLSARIEALADLFNGPDEMAYESLNLFSTFMLGEDFILDAFPSDQGYRAYYGRASQAEQWEQALYEHHEFCIRNSIDY